MRHILKTVQIVALVCWAYPRSGLDMDTHSTNLGMWLKLPTAVLPSTSAWKWTIYSDCDEVILIASKRTRAGHIERSCERPLERGPTPPVTVLHRRMNSEFSNWFVVQTVLSFCFEGLIASGWGCVRSPNMYIHSDGRRIIKTRNAHANCNFQIGRVSRASRQERARSARYGFSHVCDRRFCAWKSRTADPQRDGWAKQQPATAVAARSEVVSQRGSRSDKPC